eukprot:2536213-Pleurochrysis_carterae.AAC.3
MGQIARGDGHRAASIYEQAGNSHLCPRSQKQPSGNRCDDAKVAVHEDGRIHVASLVALGVSNALPNGVGNVAAGKDCSSELKDHGQHARLPDSKCLGAHARGISITSSKPARFRRSCDIHAHTMALSTGSHD